jgi:hypothetical protein
MNKTTLGVVLIYAAGALCGAGNGTLDWRVLVYGLLMGIGWILVDAEARRLQRLLDEQARQMMLQQMRNPRPTSVVDSLKGFQQ